MQRSVRILMAASAVITVISVLASSAGLADDSRQQNKNLWRNLAIGGGAVAVNGLVHHNGAETLIGAAGAAYAANRYEQDRRSQAAAERRARWRHHHHHYRHHNAQ
ncbi:MAG: hypothetical protein ACLQVD_11045 [Capsulimonadaceae bacterium]